LLLHSTTEAKDTIQYDTSIQKNIAWDELNPRAIGFVKDYLAVHQERLIKMKEWGAPYFVMIENILKRYHLPPSLKYLAVIESDLQSTALSSAGAVGPWQLMPGTAKELGLTVSKTRDDRTDLNKSTHAAARFLSMLHEKLGDWLLVVAAYNGGPARLDNIIKRKDKKDFWAIQNELPAESRNHVKKFIATHYIFEGEGSETTGKIATAPVLIPTDELKTLDSIMVSGRYHANAIITLLGLDAVRFNRWNPLFNEKVSKETYLLKIPRDKKLEFISKKEEILKSSVWLSLEEGNKKLEGFPLPLPVTKESTKSPVKKKKGKN
jgi:membrane-bound lytic murein transglycosylase D